MTWWWMAAAEKRRKTTWHRTASGRVVKFRRI